MSRIKHFPLLLQGTCEFCKKQKGCNAPCAPVEAHLRFKNSAPMEKPIGDDVIMVFPTRRNVFHRSVYESDRPSDKDFAFSTVNKCAFLRDIKPKLRQTNIFLDRFFYGLSPAEAAVKYETSVDTVQYLYQHAKERLIKVATAMDRIELARSTGEVLACFPKRIRFFLLHSLLGLSVGEIAKTCNAPTGSVSLGIASVRNKLLAGEVDFTPEATDAERAAAIRRLMNQRKENEDAVTRPKIPIAILARANQFFTRQQRWFLLRYLFHMTLTEIAEKEGAQVPNVKNQIQAVADQIILGNAGDFLAGFEFTQDEIDAARTRVEGTRARRRAEHKKRQQHAAGVQN